MQTAALCWGSPLNIVEHWKYPLAASMLKCWGTNSDGQLGCTCTSCTSRHASITLLNMYVCMYAYTCICTSCTRCVSSPCLDHVSQLVISNKLQKAYMYVRTWVPSVNKDHMHVKTTQILFQTRYRKHTCMSKIWCPRSSSQM
jgi:hypothetical protein